MSRTAMQPVELNQAWSFRVKIMENVIRAFETSINALELGTWYGEGSMSLWLKHLKPGSSLTVIDAWRAYSSRADLNVDGERYHQMDAMVSEAFLSTFLNIRKFEHYNQDRVTINMIRGSSKDVLRMFADDVFDFIYIDGDHKYDVVKADIVNAKRLSKSSLSVICGDDLEQLPTPELVAVAQRHKDRDYVKQPSEFHPGVLLAVAEEFAQVNMLNGFWWIIKHNGEYVLEVG